MKQLIFIDNDNETCTKRDTNLIHIFMKNFVSEYHLSNLKTISDFHTLSHDKMFEILFDKNNFIITSSAFTATHYNSLGQLISILKTASICNITDMCYVDVSCYLERTLQSFITASDNKNTYHIMNAIETNNNIIRTEDNYISTYKRLRIELKGAFKSIFKYEDINLNSLIEN